MFSSHLDLLLTCTSFLFANNHTVFSAPQKVTDLAEYIKEKIWLDPKAADLQWSLFVAALNSYRYDSVLRPFPPMFHQEDGEKDHKAMVCTEL